MTLTRGRRYAPSEVRRLHPDRQPVPLEPYRLDEPAPGQGQGHRRTSGDGTIRWCPYCDTVLQTRARACDDCRPRRTQVMATRPRDRSVTPVENPERANLVILLESVDRMSAVVGRASAQLNKGELRARLLEDWFGASKEVMVAADALRER